MSDYDDQPCSVFYPNQQTAPVQNRVLLSHLPRVVENLTPLKQAEEVAVKKKSCLATASSRKPIPDHPQNHRKTVAFGKTVNVSQTVEATSRTAKRMASSPAQRLNVTAPAAAASPVQEGQDDWRKVVREEMETMRKEMQEETVKRQEALNNENLNKMQEMMSQFMQQLAVTKPTAAPEDKENVYERRHQESRPKPPNKVAIARQILKKEGRITPEAIPFLERRIQQDPIFRQQVDDVLADAEYDFDKGSYSPPPPVSYAAPTGNNAGNPSMMRETLTVERSIRYDNGLASLDSRQWTKEQSGGRGNQDRWKNYEPDPVLQSTYQPGNSVSYYPSATDRNRQNRGRNGGYYVEHTSDQDEDEIVDDFGESASETQAERERRIREKYSRRK